MKSTQIDFIWIDDGKRHDKKLERKDLYAVFYGLAEGFQDDNQISKKMIEEILPVADSIVINKDQNSVEDVPAISYEVDGQTKLLKIIRYHKIVWAILDKYCTE